MDDPLSSVQVCLQNLDLGLNSLLNIVADVSTPISPLSLVTSSSIDIITSRAFETLNFILFYL